MRSLKYPGVLGKEVFLGRLKVPPGRLEWNCGGFCCGMCLGVAETLGWDRFWAVWEIGGILLWVCGEKRKRVGRKGRIFVNEYRAGFGFGFSDLGLGDWGRLWISGRGVGICCGIRMWTTWWISG